MAFAGLLLAAALGVIIIWLATGGDDEDTASTVQRGSVASGEPGEASELGEGTPSANVARPPPADGLANPPRRLRAIHTRVRRGRALTDAQQRVLRQYQQDHPDDPTPSLLLAHDHVGRLWLTAALERYGLVNRIDPAARGTPWMLSDLISMAKTTSHGRPAAAMIAEIYGREALPAIDAALADDDLDAAVRSRLQRLRRRLAR